MWIWILQFAAGLTNEVIPEEIKNRRVENHGIIKTGKWYVYSVYKDTHYHYKSCIILDWSSIIIFKLFILLCFTGYFYEVLSNCTQLHIYALTSVNTIKIFKNVCIMSVNLSLPFCSLISVRHIICAQGIFCSSSSVMLQANITQDLTLFGCLKLVYVCMAGLLQQELGLCQGLNLHRTNTNTEKIQTHFHTLSGIWTYNPNVQGGEDGIHFNILLPIVVLPFAKFFRNIFST